MMPNHDNQDLGHQRQAFERGRGGSQEKRGKIPNHGQLWLGELAISMPKNSINQDEWLGQRKGR